MSVTKQKMISFLAERYSGSVQTRGLWLWSDGDGKDIPYLNSAENQWIELWALAEKEETSIAPQNLIQEALLDTPGDEFLIGCLISISQNKNAAIKNNARLFVEILEYWGSKLEIDSIRGGLLIFGDCSVRDGVSALIPALNGKIDEELCDKWEPWFQKIKKERQTASIKGIFGLLDLMLDALMANVPRIDSEKFLLIAPKVKAYFEKVLKGLEDLPQDDTAQDSKIDPEELVEVKPNDKLILDSLIKELMPLIDSFSEIIPQTLNSASNTALIGIPRIFEISKIIAAEKKWPGSSEPAGICFKSIWATKSKKTEDETTKNS
jgi:hypothetical protein